VEVVAAADDSSEVDGAAPLAGLDNGRAPLRVVFVIATGEAANQNVPLS